MKRKFGRFSAAAALVARSSTMAAHLAMLVVLGIWKPRNMRRNVRSHHSRRGASRWQIAGCGSGSPWQTSSVNMDTPYYCEPRHGLDEAQDIHRPPEDHA